MNETQLRENIRDAAVKLGWLVYFTWNSLHSPKGFPDMVMVRDGELIFAELKSDKGKLTPDQELWKGALEIVESMNFHVAYFIWRPEDWNNNTILETLL